MDKNYKILSKLRLISDIDNNIELLQTAKINMSIHEIINKPNKLIGKLC